MYRTLLLIALLAIPLGALDRMTFDDGVVLTVKVLQQTDDSYIYLDEKGQTNSALKADLKGVEFNVGEDKFLAAALEETDAARQLLLLEKSVQRYPKDRANYIYYVRVLLREMQTEKAGAILTNRALDNPGFDLLRVWWLLKSKDGESALKALKKISRRKWNENQTMQAALLEGFALADSDKWTDAQRHLDGVEAKYGMRLWGSHTALMAYEDYPHFRRSLNSVVFLSQTSFRTAGKKKSLRPNITRYWKRLTEVPPGTPLVETMVIHQAPAAANAQTGLALVGSALFGIGVAHGVMLADQGQDWLEAKTWYESASRSWELSSTGTDPSMTSGNNNNDNNNVAANIRDVLAFKKSFTAYGWYDSWSQSLSSTSAFTFGFSVSGLALTVFAVGDPFRFFERRVYRRPPMHMKFVTDPRTENGLKISAGLSGVTLMAAGLTFGFYAGYWGSIAQDRGAAYQANVTPEKFDFIYSQYGLAQKRADAYRVTSMVSFAAGALCAALYFWDPFKRKPTQALILPYIENGGVGLALVGSLP